MVPVYPVRAKCHSISAKCLPPFFAAPFATFPYSVCSMREIQEVKLHTQRHLACELHTKRSNPVLSRTEGSAGTSITSSNILPCISTFWGPNRTGLWRKTVPCVSTVTLPAFHIKWKACEITWVQFPARAWGLFLLHKVQICSGAHQAPYSMDVGGPFSGGKWLGLEVDRSPPSSGKVKNEWRCSSTSRICFHGVDGHYIAIWQLCSDLFGW